MKLSCNRMPRVCCVCNAHARELWVQKRVCVLVLCLQTRARKCHDSVMTLIIHARAEAVLCAGRVLACLLCKCMCACVLIWPMRARKCCAVVANAHPRMCDACVFMRMLVEVVNASDVLCPKPCACMCVVRAVRARHMLACKCACLCFVC